MRFTLDANAAQSIGTGIGSIFKAAALGPMYRQQAEQQALQSAADVYLRNMQGNQAGATARKVLEEATGLGLTNEARQAPIDTSLPDYLQMAQRVFQWTGDTNADRVAGAGTALQTQGIRDQALANVGDVDMMNRLNTLAAPGQTYEPFRAVGNTGVSLNQATGAQDVTNALLSRLFASESNAQASRDNAAAGASNAQAQRALAEADIEAQKAERLRTTGALPGTGAEGSEGALSSTILNTLLVPQFDDRGRPVRNPMTGEAEREIDQDALRAFYTWSSENGRRPTATAFAQWEAQGRPGANKNPATGAQAGTIPEAPRDPAQRQANTVYQTPRGPLRWTGTGWVPAQ